MYYILIALGLTNYKGDIINKISILEDEKKILSFDGLEKIKKIDKNLNFLKKIRIDIDNKKIEDLNSLDKTLKILK